MDTSLLEEFLAPYNNGKRKFNLLVNQLKKTVSDNPSQVVLLGEIEKNILEWQMNIAKPIIKQRSKVGQLGESTMNDIVKIVGEAKGKTYFDKFHSQIDLFINREEKLMKTRQAGAESIFHETRNNIKDLQSAFKMVDHTHKVIQEAMKIEASAVNMETGMRGYLLAGREELLDPYKTGENKFGQLVKNLQGVVDDNPPQVELLGSINQTINTWKYEVTQPMIELRRKIGDAKTMNDLSKLVAQAKGKVFFDKFRDQIKLFSDREEKLMIQRRKDAEGTAIRTKQIIIYGVFITIILSLFLSLYLAKNIKKSILKIVHTMKAISQGDMTQRLDTDMNDEIGDLSKSVNMMTNDLSSMISKIQGNSDILSDASSQLATVSSEMATSANEMTEQSNSVASITEQMSVNINTMASAVEQMSNSTGSVSSVANEMSDQMNSVTKTIEDMNNSIVGIKNNSTEGIRIAEEAMEMSDTATKTMNVLSDAAGEIGKVTDTIKSIAEKTNLLALNATIEAASAGSAGKGFAVVANEIKELANRSAQAAEDIANRISGVQNNSSEAVNVIEKVSNIIKKINDSINVTTSSVEAQTQTSNDISSNVSVANDGIKNMAISINEISKGANEIAGNTGEAAKGANEVAFSITEVSKSAKKSNVGAQEVNSSADKLKTVAEELKVLIGKFKIDNIK